MIITSHAGHNPDNRIACGAVGLIKESTEARKVNEKVIQILRTAGHTVYDCTCDNGISQTDVLNKIVNKCNTYAAGINISIHFNSGANRTAEDGETTGTEAFIYSINSESNKYGKAINTRIEELGFKNRGIKVNPKLTVLKNTKSPTILVECCFVDDGDDVKLYNADKMADAIAKGIIDIAEGTVKRSGWVNEAGKWYYYDPINNKMMKGFILIGGKTYYMTGDGSMLTEPRLFTPDSSGKL